MNRPIPTPLLSRDPRSYSSQASLNAGQPPTNSTFGEGSSLSSPSLRPSLLLHHRGTTSIISEHRLSLSPPGSPLGTLSAMQRDLHHHQFQFNHALNHSDPLLPGPRNLQQQQQKKQPDSNSSDQLLLSMQAKLDEVELASSSELVFGAAHVKALEELRTAQIQLAQAWMRSESEDILDGEHAEITKRPFGDGGGSTSGGLGAGGGDDTATGENGAGTVDGTLLSDSNTGLGMGTGAGSIGGRSSTREVLDTDILLARKRREVNDAHFRKVSMSVMDVIQKLEHVATAMSDVELESRDIWASGSES